MLLLHEIQGVPEKTHVREKLITSLTGDFLGYLVHYMIMLSNANPHFLTIIIITLAEKRHNCSLIYKTQFLIIFVSLWNSKLFMIFKHLFCCNPDCFTVSHQLHISNLTLSTLAHGALLTIKLRIYLEHRESL